jgi:hypothetical protein
MSYIISVTSETHQAVYDLIAECREVQKTNYEEGFNRYKAGLTSLLGEEKSTLFLEKRGHLWVPMVEANNTLLARGDS